MSVTCSLNYLLSSSVPNSPVRVICKDLASFSGHCEKQHNLSNTSIWYLLGMRSKNGLTSEVGENSPGQGKSGKEETVS